MKNILTLTLDNIVLNSGLSKILLSLFFLSWISYVMGSYKKSGL